MNPGSNPGREDSELAFLKERLLELQLAYEQALPGQLRKLETQRRRLHLPHHTLKLRKAFHRGVHSLSGSGATFGHQALGDAARELALFLESLTPPPEPLSPGVLEHIDLLFHALQAEVEAVTHARHPLGQSRGLASVEVSNGSHP